MERLGVWDFPFKMTIDTRNLSENSTDNKTFKLPLTSVQFQPLVVNWGDDTEDSISFYNDPKLVHEYEYEGEYDITISGASFGIGFGNMGDRLKLLSISDWGGSQLMVGGFQGCENLTLDDVMGIPKNSIRNLRSLFQDCKGLKTINNIEQWDVYNVPNMANMFNGATQFNQDISAWNFNHNVVLEGFMANKSNYNPEYYDALLKQLSVKVLENPRTQANRKLGMGGVKFTVKGKPFRDLLIQNGWIITDGGQV